MKKASVCGHGPAFRVVRLCLGLLFPMLGGCGSSGTLRIDSIAPETGMMSHDAFDTAVYRTTGPQDMQVMLIAGTIENPSAALHIRMRYLSSPGSTPVSSDATNAVVNYLVFDSDTVRVYGGAGMLHLHDTLGSKQVAGRLRNATLRLMDAGSPTVRDSGDDTVTDPDADADANANADADADAEGDTDRPAVTVVIDEQTVTSAVANGTFTAGRDDLRTMRLIRQIRQRIRDQLTYPRLARIH